MFVSEGKSNLIWTIREVKNLHVRRQQDRESKPPPAVKSNEIESHKEQHEHVPYDDCEAIVDDSNDGLVKELEENIVEEEKVGGFCVISAKN